MTLVYRLLGIIARVNHGLRHIHVHGLPLNWAVFLILGCVLLGAWLDVRGAGHWRTWGLPLSVPFVVLLGLFGVCQLRRDVIFRRVEVEPPVLDHLDLPPHIAFRVSAWFSLDETGKSRWARLWDTLVSGMPKTRWFVDVPAEVVTLESGELAFVSYLDPSLRLGGVLRLENKAGAWLASFLGDSVEEPEWGLLYLGFSVRPALRLRYDNTKRRRRTAVLSFDDEPSRAVFAAWLSDLRSRFENDPTPEQAESA